MNTVGRFRVRHALRVAGLAGLASCLAALGLSACGSDESAATAHVVGPSRVAAGRYLVKIGGCNDCHTPGWMEGKKVPEKDWLTGVPIGWHGPWGTTYAPNLRLAVQMYTEKTFVHTMMGRNASPPMPWTSLHAMTDADLGAIYAFIKSLGPAGKPVPPDLKPGTRPKTPYIEMAPVKPGSAKSGH